jgi:hypothetical protein
MPSLEAATATSSKPLEEQQATSSKQQATRA